MHPDIPDEFNPEYNWCKYWVAGLGAGSPSRIDVYNENIKNHNIYDNEGRKNFEEIKKYVNSAETLEYFRKIATINFYGDKTCQLMIYGGATIDFFLLIRDLRNARRNSREISKILATLTKQVNAAALNGVISKMYYTANNISSNPDRNIPNKADRFIENEITKIYNLLIIGGKRPAIDIPDKASVPFMFVQELNKSIEEISTKKELSQMEIKNIIDNIRQTTINEFLDN